MSSTTPYVPPTAPSPLEEQRRKEDEALAMMSKEIQQYEIMQYAIGAVTAFGSWWMRKHSYPWLYVAPVIVAGLGAVGMVFAKQTKLLNLRERINMMREVQEQTL